MIWNGIHGSCRFATLVMSCGAAVTQISPDVATKLTVYHLNPASAGALPVNMDTGDVRGDLYFYLGQFLLPLECKNVSGESRAHFDCDNPERVDPNRVVTSANLEIDKRFTNYSACNLCNGTDPFSHKPCEKGTYVCDCFSQSGGGCDPKRVGIESITEHFAPHTPTETCTNSLHAACGNAQHNISTCYACLKTHMSQFRDCDRRDLEGFCPSRWQHCDATAPEWACWAENIPRKTGGNWYSTMKEGQCTESATPGHCSWRVLSMKTIRADCLKEKLVSTVEFHGPECFDSCGPRSETSSCWITCFFDTVLGTDARHSTSKPLGGIPIAEIERAWADAFLPKDKGGCGEVALPSLSALVI